MMYDVIYDVYYNSGFSVWNYYWELFGIIGNCSEIHSWKHPVESGGDYLLIFSAGIKLLL